MISAARGFHQRENKPFWWSHFDRLNNPVDEWGDMPGVFLADEATVDADWHVPQGARKPQRWVRLTGSLAAGELTGDMFALYEPPTPAGLSDDPERRAYGAEHWRFNWTNGCIAVTNREIDEIWQRVEVGTPIDIRP